MNKMKRHVWLVCGLLAAAVAGSARAGDMIPDAAGKTGAFTVKLKNNCNESDREAIAKRTKAGGYAKHDLNMTSFDVYVPKEPGKDGKYALMVAQNFNELGKPPTSFEPILEKYHIIWIGPQGVTDGSPPTMRLGYTLDAVYNAENTWPIDMTRVYLFNTSKDHPGADAAMYYADIFTASISSTQLVWFHKLPSSSMKGYTWDFPPMAKLEPDMAKLAKTRKFVIIDRSEDKVTGMNTDVMNEGYVKEGFKLAKIKSTKTDLAAKYLTIKPDWFEEAMTYIESGSGGSASTQPATAVTPSVPLAGMAEVAAAPAAPEPAAKAPVPAAAAPGANAMPNGKPAAATKPAAPTVVVPQVSAEEVAEEKASKALSLARTYWASGKSDIAKTKLQALIKQYPKTNAAKDAKTLLDQLNAGP